MARSRDGYELNCHDSKWKGGDATRFTLMREGKELRGNEMEVNGDAS